jgi:diguanylate cyclase (GGDEF)-like protein
MDPRRDATPDREPLSAEEALRRGTDARAAAHYEEALACLLAALDAARSVSDVEREAAALRTIGYVYDDLGDYAAALDHHLQALALDEARGDDAARAATLRTIGIVYSKSGDAAQGLEFDRQSLELARRAGEPESVAKTLNNIGIDCKNLGRLDDAQTALEEALAIFRQISHTGGQAGALTNLGLVHARRGEFDRAEDCHRRALPLARAAAYLLAEINAARDLGLLLTQQGRLDEARRYLDEALAAAGRMGTRPELAACHRALADVHKRAGRPAQALEHFEKYHELERLVFNEESDRALKRLQVRYRVAELERTSLEDGLTGLANRRQFDARLQAEFERATHGAQSLTLAVADIDHFKTINDRFLHVVGDEVLRVVARILTQQVRAGELAARYGGEEFSLLLDGEGDDACAACERVRAAVEQFDWTRVHPGLHVTLSIGLARRAEAATAQDLLRLADARLYRAKAGGRNCVCAD